MENVQKELSDQFWNTHFPNLLEEKFDECDAIQINFWENLKHALEDVDIETVKAVMLSIPAIKIASNEMYGKIVKVAKRVWDTKRKSS